MTEVLVVQHAQCSRHMLSATEDAETANGSAASQRCTSQLCPTVSVDALPDCD